MKVNFTETVLRDANQSLLATRLRRDDFEDILSVMDQAGYYSVECWGGAVFDACIRYLDEDPWERLKFMRKNMPHSRLQMLLRGQSLLGYKHYPDDVVRKFVFNSVEKGIDIIRIFDAMNNVNNIRVAVDETLKCGAHPSCAISYTVSPVHNIEGYIELAKRMEDIGARSICIKDMSGILAPDTAFELVSRLKECISVPLALHSHCSTGYAYMTYLKAMEAGIDILDTAVSSFSGGTSQPATEVLAKVAADMGAQVEVDFKKVNIINDHFSKIMESKMKSGALETKVLLTRPKTIENQIPGGMYSNLLAQLKSQGMEDKIDEVLQEVVKVRKDLGYPPLVTPISQMVGTQAAVNVITGERYQQVIEEIKAFFRGEYGTPQGEVNRSLMEKLTGTTEFPSERISKHLPKQYEIQKEKLIRHKCGRSDILTTILFPGMGEEFIKKRNAGKDKLLRYQVREIGEAYNTKHLKRITDSSPKLLKEILKIILAYRTNSAVETIHLNEIYEIEG